MRRPKKVTNEECAKLNTLRKNYVKKTFTRGEVMNIIKEEIGWKRGEILNQLLRKVFVKVAHGKYQFPEEPIYIKKLQLVFDSKRSQPVDESISKAITLLKSKGFKITKETFDIDKAMKHPEQPVQDFINVQIF